MFKGSSIKYDIERDDCTDITGRYCEIYVKAQSESEAYDLALNVLEVTNNSDCGCDDIQEVKTGIFEAVVYIPVNDIHEFDKLKEIYKDWKSTAKEISFEKVESSNSEPVVISEESQTTNEEVSTIENTDTTPVSENLIQVTEPKETCTDIQETPSTPQYRIYQTVIDLKGTTLQVGQKYRLDLLNGTNVSEVTELNNLVWMKFTEGYNDGIINTMYIEIIGQKSSVIKSQLCNSNDKKLQGKFINIEQAKELLNNGNYGVRLNTITSKINIVKLDDIYNNLFPLKYSTFYKIVNDLKLKRTHTTLGECLYQLIEV